MRNCGVREFGTELIKENVPRLFVTSRGSSLISACFHFRWTSGSPDTPPCASLTCGLSSTWKNLVSSKNLSCSSCRAHDRA